VLWPMERGTGGVFGDVLLAEKACVVVFEVRCGRAAVAKR